MSLPNFSWASWGKQDIMIFDKDGTLTMTKSGRPCPNDVDDIEVLPNVKDVLKNMNEQGINLAIVSNQLGVEHGYMTEKTANEIMEKTIELLEVPFVKYSISCYKDDEENPPKPNGKMLFDIANVYDKIAYVGNEVVDIEAVVDLQRRIGKRYEDFSYGGVKLLKPYPTFLWAHLLFHRGLDTELIEGVGCFYKEELKRHSKRKQAINKAKLQGVNNGDSKE